MLMLELSVSFVGVAWSAHWLQLTWEAELDQKIFERAALGALLSVIAHFSEDRDYLYLAGKGDASLLQAHHWGQNVCSLWLAAEAL